MSKYTTELRFLSPENWTDEIMFGSYPIFNESHRAELNAKIREYYAFEEIGFETPARFCQRMRSRMNNIMPYYNQLYESALAEIDPFITKRYGTTSNDILNAVGKKTSETNRELKDVMQDIIDSLTNKVSKQDDTTTANGTQDTESNSTTNKNGKSVDVYEDEKEGSSTANTTTDVATSNTTSVDDTGNVTTTFNNVKDVSVKTGSQSNRDNIKHDIVTKNVSSDTPEGLVSLNDIESSMYASNANITHVTDTPTGTNTTSYDNLTDTKTRSGSQVEQRDLNSESVSNGSSNEVSKTTSNATENSSGEKTSTTTDTITDNTTTNTTTSDKTVFDGNSKEDITFHSEENKTDVITEVINGVINDINDEKKEGKTEVLGFDGITMSEMLMKWRDTFINIDQLIIDELGDLFMCLF